MTMKAEGRIIDAYTPQRVNMERRTELVLSGIDYH